MKNSISSYHYWSNMAQTYMDMTLPFLNYGMYKDCISSADLAIKAMLRAICINEIGAPPSKLRAPNELIKHTCMIYKVDFNTEMLIREVFFLNGNYEQLITRTPQKEQIFNLLKRIDVLLNDFSRRIDDCSEESRYCPVWSE
jgi:hypothetical protein